MTTQPRSGADPLERVLRGLLEPPESGLGALELAEVIWLARLMPRTAGSGGTTSGSDTGGHDDEKAGGPLDSGAGKGDSKKSEDGLKSDPLPGRQEWERELLPSFFPTSPPSPTPAEVPRAGLLPEAALPNDDDVAALLPLWVNDVAVLPDPLPYQGALQRLRHLEPFQPADPTRLELDEEATVEAYARTQRLWPEFRPRREPHLSLVLLVDGGLSMEVWHRLAEEWLALVSLAGVFRAARRISIDPALPERAMGAIGAGGEEEMVLLLSDCSGRHWWKGGGMHALLQRLGRRRSVAILQVLPSWMWRRTALGIGELVALRNRVPLGGSGGYSTAPLRWWEERPAQTGDAGPLVPVVPLDPASLAAWSNLVGGAGLSGTTGVRLPPRWPRILISDPPATANPEEAAQRVRSRLVRFFQRSSAGGRRLLQVMAAAPVLTLPVIRLLQAAMVPGERSPLGMAEVLLSGLVRRLDDDSETGRVTDRQRRPDLIQFGFDEGVREALLDWLPPADTADVVQRVSELVERRWDQLDGVPPFRAYLADPTALPPDHTMAPMAAFATATADIIERLGGRYRAYAQKLRETARMPSDDIWPKASFPFEPLEFDTAMLLAIPEPEQRRFDWATLEEIKLQSITFTTATIELGASSPSEDPSPAASESDTDTEAGETVWMGTRSVLEVSAETRSPGTTWGYHEPLTPGPAATTADPPALTMLRIPAGSYLMGSPDDEIERHTDEGPQHEVHLEEFFLARNPITQAQWRVVARWQPLEGELAWDRELKEDPLGTEVDSRFRGDDRPVVNVSWHDAMEFCRRLSKRTGKSYTLPSEAQWEYACRAGTTTPFHFGATISPELVNYDATSSYAGGPAGEYREQTTDVASFPANAWGLHDMHGNVLEWCLDHWHDSYVEGDEKAPTDGSAWKKQTAEEGESRLLRGGSWDFNPRNCRAAYRSYYHPDNSSYFIGFRVCCLPQDLFLDP